MAEGDSITIRMLGRVPTDVARRLRRLYEAAFPSHLRGPWEDLSDEVSAGTVLLWVALHGADPVGFAEGRPLGDGLPLFLEYIAVEPAARSHGVGGAMLAAVRAHPAASAGVILEIEPLDEGDAEQRHESARRDEFYRRHGAIEVLCAPGYRVPGEGSLHRLSLRWLPGGTLEGAPAGQRLRSILHAIATEGYDLEIDSAEYSAITGGLVC